MTMVTRDAFEYINDTRIKRKQQLNADT